MSLIADALKRAQEQRGGGRDDGARRLLTPSGPLRVEGRGRRRGGVPRSLAVAGLGLAFSVVAFALAVILSPRSDLATTSALAAAPAPRGESGGAEGAEPLDLPELRLTEGAGAGGEAAGYRSDGVASRSGFEGESSRYRGDGSAVSGSSGDGSGDAASLGKDAGPATPSPRAGRGEAGPAGVPVESAEASSFRMALSGGGVSADLAARALTAQRQGDHERAAGLYQRALELTPADPQLHNNLGTVYRALGQPEEAYRAFEAALAADVEYAPAWSNLGIVLDALGRSEEAEKAYREALRLDPSNAGARVNLANAYAERGAVPQALGLLRTALTDDPDLPEAHYAMARLLESGGDLAGARRHYTAFLETGSGRFGDLEARVRERLAALATPGGE